jgi:esterase/lipase superfamily enzyme
MTYYKYKGRSLILTIRTVLLFLLLALIGPEANAQVDESISFSNEKTRDYIYVITNRKIDTTRENLSFNDEVNENARLTFIKASANKSDQIKSQSLDYDDFMAQACNETSDWLLFVHGDSKTYNKSVQRGLEIQKFHNINVIVFSWPSKNPDLNGLKNLHNSQVNVLKSKKHFNELLAFIASFRKLNTSFNENANLSMLLHSLGNLYLENLVKESTNERILNPIFENVIINSAAVNQKMHQEWVEKIDFQNRIYITNNKSDFNLKGAHIFTKNGNQLGEKAKSPTAKNANYVQFSKAVGFRFPTGTTHTYFIGKVPNQSQNIRAFYFDVFHGKKIDFSDQSHFTKRKKGVGYDVKL